jgi:hypothetical protein
MNVLRARHVPVERAGTTWGERMNRRGLVERDLLRRQSASAATAARAAAAPAIESTK